MSDMNRLALLATNPNDATREEIYLAVASLYRIQDVHMNARERDLTKDILRRLTKDVEMSIRIALAERLADETNAPHELILMLADDSIEVARPIILRSPLLTERDMLRLIAETDDIHREAVAARPNIGEAVCDALAVCEAPSVLRALIGNATAKISPNAFARLAETSRRIEALQEPLAGRPDMPKDVAARMCAFVSDTLRTFIVRNFTIDKQTLDSALGDAAATLSAASPPAAPADGPANGTRKLIEKLYLAGHLKAGFLIRVLQQGNIDLFELGLARMLELPLGQTRQLLYERGAGTVALVCRAVGIDRCVFSTVFTLSRKARAMRPVLLPADLAEVDVLFARTTRTVALERLQGKSGL